MGGWMKANIIVPSGLQAQGWLEMANMIDQVLFGEKDQQKYK